MRLFVLKMMNMWTILTFSLFVLMPELLVSGESVYEAILNNKHANLSQFRQWVIEDDLLKVFLRLNTVTVFAPTDDVINDFRRNNPYYSMGSKDKDKLLANNHIVGMAVEKSSFPLRLHSQDQEMPPLYLNYKNVQPKHLRDTGRREYYVNNALIKQEFFYKTDNDKRENQILYIVDEVLKPWKAENKQLSPLANELIRYPHLYGLSDSINSFHDKILLTDQEPLFQQAGNHTFFVPVNDFALHFGDYNKYIIRGHVISNRVLFLRVMSEDVYRPAAYDDKVNVELSLLNRSIPGSYDTPFEKLQSNLIRNSMSQVTGKIISRIRQANIPVQNGVVHLIETPLMITELSIMDFINEGKFTLFSSLLNLLPNVKSKLSNKFEKKTLLLPPDTAFQQLYNGTSTYYQFIDELKRNDQRQRLENIISLHIINQFLPTTEIRLKTKHEPIKSINDKDLNLRVYNVGKRSKISVRAEGTNARTLQADVGATDGIIHIIDRVLGVRFDKINQRLNLKPQLNITNHFGNITKWNEQFLQEDSRFTYFAPNNDAWTKFKQQFPTDYDKFDRGQDLDRLKKILSSHLLYNSELSYNELRPNDKVFTGESWVKFATLDNNITLQSGDITANITTKDIRSMNGIIHIIDHVIMPITSFSDIVVANIKLLTIFLLIALFF